MADTNYYIQKLKQRKRTLILLCILVPLLISGILFLLTVHNTYSFNKELLQQERYVARMNDSYKLSFTIFFILLVIAAPLIFLINRLFNNYLILIQSLSDRDFSKLMQVNDKENFARKYMPYYIIQNNTITFFQLLRQNTIYFNEITSINVRQIFNKGFNAFIKIKTTDHLYTYWLKGNAFKVSNLVIEAVKFNPQIQVNNNWND